MVRLDTSNCEDLDCEMRRLKDEKYQSTFGCEKVIEADEKSIHGVGAKIVHHCKGFSPLPPK